LQQVGQKGRQANKAGRATKQAGQQSRQVDWMIRFTHFSALSIWDIGNITYRLTMENIC
jgi:hypothetical protein